MGNFIARYCNGDTHKYSRVHDINSFQDEIDQQRVRVNELHDNIYDEIENIKNIHSNTSQKLEDDIKSIEVFYDIRVGTLEDQMINVNSELVELKKNIQKVDSIKRKFDTLGTMLMSQSEPQLCPP
jgi:hypothetical protein